MSYREHGRFAALNLAIIAALLALAVAGLYFSPLRPPRADITIPPEAGCNLQRQACAASLADGTRVELSITPRPIPFLMPLRIEVLLTGQQADKVEIDFAGETMNMGLNRIELKPLGGGRFAGEGSLPVCVSGAMSWVATVMIETGSRRIVVLHRFEVGR